MKAYLRKLAEGTDLTREEAAEVMQLIMQGTATESQIGALLMALRLKGERPEELLGFVEVMRARAIPVPIDDPDAVDLCGTGGDGAGSFNISTAASFVVAGAGVTVAKHGNKSVSGICGSADVLAELGVTINLPPERVSACINDIGIGFLFAPAFHPAMKHASKPRADLGVKTAFNLLGPLSNPARVRRQLVGVFSYEAARLIASVYRILEPERVFVVNSNDSFDEVSLSHPTTIFDVRGGAMTEITVTPETFRLAPAPDSIARGGDANENAAIIRSILDGEQGPRRDIVIANAAVALIAAGRAAGFANAAEIADQSIASGKAMLKLRQLASFSSGL